ncbi:PREDICTED: zona pellucida sperm-binding protein 3-like [Cyprinodon variegatus]|uniref:zona pellucida sperm-binding protein 3-like n=1 Tax=Cyprinodon variegatus TaxID=28743 RepID=UPI00074290CA|nr:PREDICTED: zona pellucida sperm-binding protein 3-like [Cyprinodon variegatus]
MGFRVTIFLWFVLLISERNVCFAAQTLLLPGFNDTLNQTPREQVTSAQQGTHPSPVTVRLRTYQLRNTVALPNKQSLPGSAEETMQTPKNLLEAEAMLPSVLLQQRKNVQDQDLAQGPNLSLSSPDPGRKGSKVVLKSKQPERAPAESVSVRCGEDKVTVAVNKNFLGNGQLIRPDDLSLGGCMAVNAVDNVLLFETELHGCGGTVTMVDVALIYTYTLTYSPTPVGNTSVLKTNPAEVEIRCYFQRKHYVSSNAMRPLWKTFASEMQTKTRLQFSLHLMTDDWQSVRPSNVYSALDMMHIEAALLQGYHVPLRIFVDSCVVTVNPDPGSQPRYPFINNYGCLTDAKLTGAQSYFLPRREEDKLHFQLKGFRFKEDDRNSFYMTCQMKATTADVPIDSRHKACSFLTEAGRWVASDGDNKVCSCCETSCGGQRQKRSSEADAAAQREGMEVLGPIFLEDGELPPEPVPRLQTQDEALAASYSSTALLCGAGVAVAVVMVFVSVLVCSRHSKLTGHSVST